MRRALAPVTLLLLAVVSAPTQAQARISSLFPHLFDITSEPVLLFLTGLALLSLASVGGRTRPR